MKQTIWVLRDTHEHREGPYCSGHIRELIKAAQKDYNISEACVDDPISPHTTDLLLFRPTQDGLARHTFIKKVHAISAFSINKKSSFSGTKIAFRTLSEQINIPTPKTWIGSLFHQINPTSFHGFVVKPSKGGQGTNVVFCQTRKQVIREVRRQNSPTVVQEFVPLKTVEDIRLVMVGERLCGSMKRVVHTENTSEFRANLSLGTSRPVPYTPTEKMIEYAQKIMRHTQLDFAGIDIIVRNDHPLFLECNIRPGLKGIVQIDDQIATRVLHALCDRAQKT